jgi:AAHS family 4-hydroxybenzoate transporter-like MFS transporter
MAFAVVDGFDSLVIGFVIPAVSRDWGVTPASLTGVTLAGLIGVIIGTMVLSPLADRIGRRPMILMGATVFAVFTLLAATATGMTSLGAYRFLAGIGLGVVPPAILTSVAEFAPRRIRATLVTVVGSGLASGGFVGGFLAGFLIPHWGWESVLVVGGALPLVFIVLALRWLPETPQFLASRADDRRAARVLSRIVPTYAPEAEPTFRREETVSAGVPVRSLLTEKRAVMTVVIWVLYLGQFITSFFIFSWLPSVLTSSGVGETAALIATSVCTLGGMIGGVLLGIRSDKASSRFNVLAISYTVGAAAVAVTAVTTGVSELAMFLALFVVGFGTIGTGICVNSLTASLYPPDIRSTGLGWAYGFGRVGALIGPAVGGLLLAMQLTAESIFLFSIVPVMLCAAAVVTLSLVVRRRQANLPAGSTEFVQLVAGASA